MKQLEEQRNQIAEQQRQYSTNIPIEPIVGDAQRVMVTEQHDADMVQFQAVPITNMVQFYEVPILDLVSLENKLISVNLFHVRIYRHKFHDVALVLLQM